MNPFPLFLLLLSYISGSIPFGLVIAKARGINLMNTGSGNIGATNVLRSVGKKEAFFTLTGDILKGVFPVILLRSTGYGEPYTALSCLLSVLGHNFSVFLGFRGGKGVATSIGVVLAYLPTVGLVTVALWVVVVFFFRYSSLGALVAFGLLPVNMVIFNSTREGLILSILLALLIFFKHRKNIKRLANGTEPKVGQSNKG